MPGMGTLYLVRHGQASFGAADYDQLSELGQRQALQLGRYWAERGLRFDGVLMGSLRRHAQTWEGIRNGAGFDQEPLIWPGLNEYDGDAIIRALHPDAVDKPPEKFATEFKGDDLGAWSIVRGPSRLLLFLTVHRAGEYVQERWRDSVVKPLASLPQEQQVEALYGPQGKLGAFVNDWLKPFISEKERLPMKVAGIAMPLTPGYQSMVAAERKFLPVLDNGPPFLAGSFTLTRPSDLGALDEGEAGTTFEVECRERVYRATSAGESLADATAQVFWSASSCLQAKIRISVVPPAQVGADTTQEFDPETSEMRAAAPPVAPINLTKLYDGQEGFAQLVADFATGSHAFGLDDFRESYSPTQWSDLRARLAAAKFRSARVFLQVNLSDEMKQFLGARTARAEVPNVILE